MIAIASTRAAIGPNSGTICVPMISIFSAPAINGTVSVLVVALGVSVKLSFSSPSTRTKKLSSLTPAFASNTDLGMLRVI
ncbi:Uncharacterised protein [uncultured archaeon]|nr:Uncharacterised protein [uncultured archaeon]